MATVKELHGKPVRRQKKKKELVDESIQGTNSSSIVSKRSVERLYWARKQGRNHVEFFRQFVPKPIRRSPVINRGYWTRMEAMRHVISKVTRSEFKGNKVIINLGCGFDPYAFQFLNDNKDRCDVFFVDVDYPDLMIKKANTLRNDPALMSIVGEELMKSSEHILFYTRKYAAIACDLRELEKFQTLLSSLFHLENTLVLFTAEVSITYMTRESADALIRWSATLPYAEFALLEQLMPVGPDHPFSRTMMAHFEILKTPLHSVSTYPTTEDQRQRFLLRGWKYVDVKDLYEFWQTCVTNEEKAFVASVEDFDEWEEFILFCQYYFVLHASNWQNIGAEPVVMPAQTARYSEVEPEIFPSVVNGPGISLARRKYAAGTTYRDSSVVIHGGADTTRKSDELLISLASEDESLEIDREVSTARVCHAVTKLGNGDVILVGGRKSPSQPLKDCWILSGGSWQQIHSLPSARFRHCMFAVGDDVYVYGGCVHDEPSPWLKWTREHGWAYIQPVGAAQLGNRVSACVAWNDKLGYGYLLGGMLKENIQSDVYKLESADGELSIEKVRHSDVLLTRYGAKAVLKSNGDLIIAGGVGPYRVFTNQEAVVKVLFEPRFIVSVGVLAGLPDKLPLLCGFNMDIVGDEHVIVYGGGAVCFSFGSYWNGVYVSSTAQTPQKVAIKPKRRRPASGTPFPNSSLALAVRTEIQRKEACTAAEFKQICDSGKPVLFTKTALGACIHKWDKEFLKSRVGADRSVVVHASDTGSLNFNAKNFKYQTMLFGEFMDRVFDKQDHLYFRALSASKPKDAPAMFEEDFPELANDFQLPPFARHLKDYHFSSPLRVSSPNTSMWLHYDVTANILCQIIGTKRVRMYPPQDVVHLLFPPGSSSSTIGNVFEENPARELVHPLEFTMEPGDVVFIPPLWLHATNPLTPSISLNFFWKDLSDTAYAHGKDVYGNRDLGSYETGRKLVDRISSGFKDLPHDIRQFYLLRLADELRQAAL